MIRNYKGYVFEDREISWLRFNERVLQEAENSSTPLMERLKFLAIFSSNLDEFFRVRVAQIRKVQRINAKKPISEWQASPDEILAEVQRIVVSLQDRFTAIYQNDILPSLALKKIFLVNENELNELQKLAVDAYFKDSILNRLFPIILDDLKHSPHLRDRSIYLAVRMTDSNETKAPKHALIEVPTSTSGRFYQLPKTDENTFIICTEDIIRLSLKEIFQQFDYDTFEAHIVKITRDAELNFDKSETDYHVPILVKIQKSIKQRSKGLPTRFVFDERMPKVFLDLISIKLELKNVNLIPGGRYHNFKDFMDFPKVGNEEDYYPTHTPIPVSEIDSTKTVFDVISKHDILLHHPYQSYDYLIRFLREAAIDPQVTTIKITLYRVAKFSNVVNSLINAIKNGKKVVVLMELQARFDEEANIYWTNQLQEAGAQVHFGKAGQKVHCKMCLIYRNEEGKTVKYAHLSTGNYNGVTSRIYSDFALFTKDDRYTLELETLSDLLFLNIRRNFFNHLLIAPDNMKSRFLKMIDKEIENKRALKDAYIIAKMNSLVDVEIIKKLYEANNAGVKIQLIVRGICSLVPGINGMSENISVRSIIDRFLEHARVYIFCNDGDEKIFLSSADWMTRNLQNRIELAFPIFDIKHKKTIKEIIELQLKDNIKARIKFADGTYQFAKNEEGKSFSTQLDTLEYLRNNTI